MSGLSETYGSRNGFSIHPTELTVSHTPTNHGLQSVRDIVSQNLCARSKYFFVASCCLSAPFSARSIPIIIRTAYGTKGSFPARMSPYMCNKEQTARTVYAPRLKPNRNNLSPSL